MLFNPGLLALSGPPPQRVLDNRMYWHVLIVLLGSISALRFVTLDFIGGILSALMLCMAWMIVSDGMQELGRYSLVFGMLCVLCLFFDAVPLLASLGGRSEVSIEPVKRTVSDQITRITYTTTVRTTPFFDRKQGILYNGASVAMLLSPFAMLLGAYLAIHAHVELQRYATQPYDDSEEPPQWQSDDFAARGQGTERSGEGRSLSSSGSLPARPGPGQRPVSRFQGVGRRLDA